MRTHIASVLADDVLPRFRMSATVACRRTSRSSSEHSLSLVANVSLDLPISIVSHGDSDVLTCRVRLLVTALGMAIGLISPAHVMAQKAAGTELEDGKIVVKIYVTMNQVGLPYGRPISDYTINVVSPAGERSSATTGDHGTTELRLPPGAYRIMSVKPLEWYGHHYTWDLPLEVKRGMRILDLTPDNSVNMGREYERVSIPPDSDSTRSRPDAPPDRHEQQASMSQPIEAGDIPQ
jgi:hypothetical protein